MANHSAHDTPGRQEYSAPTLRVHGSVEELTLSSTHQSAHYDNTLCYAPDEPHATTS